MVHFPIVKGRGEKKWLLRDAERFLGSGEQAVDEYQSAHNNSCDEYLPGSPSNDCDKIEKESKSREEDREHPSLWLHIPEHPEEPEEEEYDQYPEESPDKTERVKCYLSDIYRKDMQILERDN